MSLWVEDLEGGWQQESRLDGDIDTPPKLVHCHQLPCLLGGPVQGTLKHVHTYRVDYTYSKNASIFLGTNNPYMLKSFTLGKD